MGNNGNGNRSTLLTVKNIAEKGIDWFSIILLSGIFILGLAQVFWRWILHDPIVWSEELINIIYVWICYLGWTLAERSDSHVRITAVLNALPQKAQKWVQAFCHVLCILFSVLMVVYGIELIGVGAKRTAVSFPMNYAVVYLIGPICNLIIIIYEVAELIECFQKGPRDYKEHGGGEDEQ